MTRTIPGHISPSQVMAAAERLFYEATLRHLHVKCRNREIRKADIAPTARDKTAVFVHEMWLALAVGGGDDYCI